MGEYPVPRVVLTELHVRVEKAKGERTGNAVMIKLGVRPKDEVVMSQFRPPSSPIRFKITQVRDT